MKGMCLSELMCVYAYLLHNLEVWNPLFFHKYLYVPAFHFGLKYVIYHSKYTFIFFIPWQTLPNDYFYQLFEILEEIMSFKKKNPDKL